MPEDHTYGRRTTHTVATRRVVTPDLLTTVTGSSVYSCGSMTDAAKAIDERCGVPMALYWETEELAEWMVDIGFPRYKECIEKNNITGRHLICLDASRLPDIGITDFEHIKTISAEVRKLINLDHVIRNHTYAMSDPMLAYLDQKRHTGNMTDNMSFLSFLVKNKRWYKHYPTPTER